MFKTAVPFIMALVPLLGKPASLPPPHPPLPHPHLHLPLQHFFPITLTLVTFKCAAQVTYPPEAPESPPCLDLSMEEKEKGVYPRKYLLLLAYPAGAPVPF